MQRGADLLRAHHVAAANVAPGAFGRQVAPLVDAYRAARPQQSAAFDTAELIRASLRHAGHDAIVIERTGPFAGEPWLVALDVDIAKVVVRSPAGTGSS